MACGRRRISRARRSRYSLPWTGTGHIVGAVGARFRAGRLELGMPDFPDSILITPVRESHWADLKTVRLASLLDAPKAFGMRHASAAALSEAQRRERASGTRGAAFFIAQNVQETVGLIGVTAVAAGDCELIAMWVRPAQRGSGVAASLVDAVKAAAVAGGAHTVHLAVSPANLPAARFYARQGFRFLSQFEALDSDPGITLQKMAWYAPGSAR